MMSVAGAQIVQAHRVVGNRDEDRAIEVVAGCVPILGKFLEHDAIVLHPLLELVGTRAHRLAAGILVEGGRRHHHAGAVGQLRQQRGIGLGQAQHHGLGVRRLDAGDRGQLALAVAVGQRARTFQIGLDRGRVHRRAVMEHRVLRSLKVSVLLSSLVVHDCASCGTIFRSGVMSTSLSHSDAKTMRPTKVRARTGSSTSGSSCRPIRRVDWACANPVDIMAARAATRQSLRIKNLRCFLYGPPTGGFRHSGPACAGSPKRRRDARPIPVAHAHGGFCAMRAGL